MLFMSAAFLFALNTSGSSRHQFVHIHKTITDTLPQANTMNKLPKTPNDTFGGMKNMTDSNGNLKKDTSTIQRI